MASGRLVAVNSMPPAWPARFLIAAVLTAATYLVLTALASVRVDPVVWVAPEPSEPQYRQHGKPVLSGAGMAAWIVVVLAYAAVAAAALAPRTARARAIALTAIVSLVIVAVVHPSWVLLLLPEGWRWGYASAFERNGLPFGAARANWSPAVLLTFVAVPHALLTMLMTAPPRASSNRD